MDFALAVLAALICATSASLTTEQIQKLDGQPPLTGERGAAAIAEAAFLEHTHHEIKDYSMSAWKHSNTEWQFFIRGEKSFTQPGNDWFITVNKKSGAVRIEDGM